MKLIEGFDSNYRYILVAARRARQLQGGAPPVIDTGSRKPCRIAQDEIKAGKVKWLIPEIPKLPVVAASETLNKVSQKTRRIAPISCRGFRGIRNPCSVSGINSVGGAGSLKPQPPPSCYENCAGRVRWGSSL